ncbi:hypothetical protein MMPV_006202 [Pyropia vietnamensis]
MLDIPPEFLAAELPAAAAAAAVPAAVTTTTGEDHPSPPTPLRSHVAVSVDPVTHAALVRCALRLPVSPATAYAILTSPTPEAIYRSAGPVAARAVEPLPGGRSLVRLTQTGGWPRWPGAPVSTTPVPNHPACIILGWQRMQARVAPPRGIRRIVARIVGGTVGAVLEDIAAEAARLERQRIAAAAEEVVGGGTGAEGGGARGGRLTLGRRGAAAATANATSAAAERGVRLPPWAARRLAVVRGKGGR